MKIQIRKAINKSTAPYLYEAFVLDIDHFNGLQGKGMCEATAFTDLTLCMTERLEGWPRIHRGNTIEIEVI